jgi:hypothetical protein
MFQAMPCSSSGGLCRNCIHAASGIVTLCRWLSCALVKKELRSITLVNFQLDAQNSSLFIYNTFIKILYMFWASPCSSSGGLRHNCIHAASGIVTLCRWLYCALVKKELRSITLVDFQLDAQNSYLFIYNTFIKILYMFQALPYSSSGGLRRNCIHAASGIVTLCRWLSCALVKKELQCTVNQPSTLNSILCIFLPPHYFLPFRPGIFLSTHSQTPLA